MHFNIRSTNRAVYDALVTAASGLHTTYDRSTMIVLLRFKFNVTRFLTSTATEKFIMKTVCYNGNLPFSRCVKHLYWRFRLLRLGIRLDEQGVHTGCFNNGRLLSEALSKADFR